jgi:hypothetical protein
MAAKTTGRGVTLPAATISALYYTVIAFLKDPANSYWTVAGSGDGTTGGWGMDVVNAYTDLDNANFWCVLQAPGGFQLLIQREATIGRFSFISNIAGDYSGGSATVRPTSGSGAAKTLYSNVAPSTSKLDRIHIVSENGNTFDTCGWYMQAQNNRNGTDTTSALGFFPLSLPAAADLHPYAMAWVGGNQATDVRTLYNGNANTYLRSVAPDTGLFAEYKVCHPVVNQNPVTGNLGQLPNGDDAHFPCVVANASGYYKGVTTFLQSSGTARDFLSLAGTRSRVHIGLYLTVPWDPTASPPEML